jgi:hypothetical protein
MILVKKKLKYIKGPGLLAFLFLTNFTNMSGQSSFAGYVNKIFLNAFSKHPDSSIEKFMATYAPSLLQKPDPGTTWTVNTREHFSKPITIAHSCFFESHPFVDSNLTSAEFKVYTSVFPDSVSNSNIGISNFEVNLQFWSAEDAISWYEKIRDGLKVVGDLDSYYEDEYRRYFRISDNESHYDIPSGLIISAIIEKGIYGFYLVRISIN